MENLNQVSIFKDLNDKEMAILAQSMSEKKIPANTPIYVEKMIGEALYVVKAGSILIMRDISGTGDKQLATMKQGDFFGELALIDPAPRLVSAKTAEDSVLLILEADNFRKLTEKEPVLANKVISSIIKTFLNRVRMNAKYVNEYASWFLKEGPGK